MNMSNLTIKATIQWAQLEDKNQMSGKYQTDLTQLTDAAVTALQGLGINVLHKEDRGFYITTKSTRPIYAKDSDGASLQGIKIGNGSHAVAVIRPYEWTFQGKAGVSPSLDKLVITELVAYEDDAEFDTADLDEAL